MKVFVFLMEQVGIFEEKSLSFVSVRERGASLFQGPSLPRRELYDIADSAGSIQQAGVLGVIL